MVALAAVVAASPAAGQSSLGGETIQIARTSESITIDGDLSDEGWRHATRVEKWYEISPGDNTEPAVKSIGLVAYDDRFFYAAFQFDDPEPKKIRGPLADHDGINGQADDMGGLFLDTLNSGRTATLFLVNSRNVQYDAIVDDASGENQSPDFFWDSATKITERGWVLEIRIPFSSLRYKNVDPQTWGIILYRNYPRGFRYQIATAKFPRGGNCTVCRENKLTGIERLPSGGHLVAAPYVSASEGAKPRGGVAGAELVGEPIKPHAGLDVKYTPNADNAIDLTVKPDFSQVESDTAQISANERFALFFPEKRPFFLEGVDLLQTPIQAVYTRTISAPRWGGRLTGKEAGVRYTVLVSDDAGGGRAILPGSNGSSFADRDFESTVLVARAKRDIGLSSVGGLVTDRENRGGYGYNRLAGPDFQWRLSPGDVVAGQLLFSDSRTPQRVDLASEWTGQRLAGHGGHAQWQHSTTHVEWVGQYKDFSDEFRADDGFVPQVGYRSLFGDGAWVVRPKSFASLVRSGFNVEQQRDRSGGLITRRVQPNVFMQTRFSGFMLIAYTDERTRAGDTVIGRRFLNGFVRISPTRQIRTIGADWTLGQDIDFANARPAHGATINVFASLQPTDHLEIEVLQNQRALNVNDLGNPNARLLTARVSRVKSTYTFTSRMFARGIAQYESSTRDPRLFRSGVDPRSGTFSGSALFAYKINWQSVMFAGYGDERSLTDAPRRLLPSDRQFFVKLSYAFQR
jgi:hypothetical protein